MSEPAIHRQFFGDAEQSFALPAEMIIELERKTGAGIGGLCRRLFAGDFRHIEVLETIRLALIGGGTKPDDAAALVKTYAANRPLAEIYPLAVTLLELAWFGPGEKINAQASTDPKEADHAA